MKAKRREETKEEVVEKVVEEYKKEHDIQRLSNKHRDQISATLKGLGIDTSRCC